MNEVFGLHRCPHCGGKVTPTPHRGTNEPEAFRCLFCTSVICDWCYSKHTMQLHPDAGGLYPKKT